MTPSRRVIGNWLKAPGATHRPAPVYLTRFGRPAPVYLTRFARPVDQAITAAQSALFAPDGPETCDDGHCWT